MSVLDKYYRISETAGMSVHIGPEGDMTIQLCTVTASGNELNIDKKATDLKAINQLRQQLPAKSIVALNLSGKGILHKQIEKAEAIDQHNFGKILPNANIDDFYIQNFVSGESSFVSVIRKADADRWISQLTELGFRPLMLSLGPFPIESIITQLNIYEHDFIIDGYHIHRNEKAEWLRYQYNESEGSQIPLKIASEKIDQRLILPYAAAFQLVLSNAIEPVCADFGTLQAALKNKHSDNKIRVQRFIVLLVFFILLLANYIVLSALNSSNSALSEQASLYAQNTNSLQELQEQVKKKEAQLKGLGWDSGINKSSLIDQIASLLPPEINLSEIAVNPVDQASSRTERSLVFFNRKIQLIGNSQQIIPVNEWIARIKTKKWVKNVQMDSYRFDSELNTGRFLITIDY